MATKSKKVIYKPKTALGRIGFWATVWWGVSWAYLLALIWIGKDVYINRAENSGGFFSDWWFALNSAYDRSASMPIIFFVIVALWIIGGIVWLRALKAAKISYRAAFKDLFLTLR